MLLIAKSFVDVRSLGRKFLTNISDELNDSRSRSISSEGTVQYSYAWIFVGPFCTQTSSVSHHEPLVCTMSRRFTAYTGYLLVFVWYVSIRCLALALQSHLLDVLIFKLSVSPPTLQRSSSSWNHTGDWRHHYFLRNCTTPTVSFISHQYLWLTSAIYPW